MHQKAIILHTFGVQVNPCKQGAIDQGPQYLVCNVACEGHIAKHLGPTKGFGLRGLGLGFKGFRVYLNPKVCRIMASLAIFGGFGLCCFVLLGFK